MSKVFTQFKQATSTSNVTLVGYNDPNNNNIKLSFDRLVDRYKENNITNIEPVSGVVRWVGLDAQENLAILNTTLNQFTYGVLLSSSVKRLNLNFGPLNTTSATLKINHGGPSNQVVQLSSFSPALSSSMLSGAYLGLTQLAQFEFSSHSVGDMFTLFVQASTPDSLLLTITPSTSSAEVIDEYNLPSNITETKACRLLRRQRDNTYTGLLNSISEIINNILVISSTTNTIPPSGVDTDEWDRVVKCLNDQMPKRSTINGAAFKLRESIAYPTVLCSASNLYPYVNLKYVFPEVSNLISSTLAINLTSCNSSLVNYFPIYLSPSTNKIVEIADSKLQTLVLGEYYNAIKIQNCSC